MRPCNCPSHPGHDLHYTDPQKKDPVRQHAPPALLNFGLRVARGRSWSLCDFDIGTSSSHKQHVEACTYVFHNDIA
jgi:hypothetical protein